MPGAVASIVHSTSRYLVSTCRPTLQCYAHPDIRNGLKSGDQAGHATGQSPPIHRA